MKTALKTREIAGHTITLKPGLRYRASRPFSSPGMTHFPVRIERLGEQPTDTGYLVLTGLTYDQANEFLRAFNNGPTSFDGRMW